MQPVYSDIISNKDIHTAGITKIQIIPREWLATDPEIDFTTGRVMVSPTLNQGRFWLLLNLTDLSYSYSETPKNTKSGDYYDVNAGGLVNTFNYALQQILETIRYSELVAIITDRNKRRKIVGDTNTAMKLTIAHTHANAPFSLEKLQIDLATQSEGLPPFFNPDNTPDTLGNFLIDSNGEYLLVE